MATGSKNVPAWVEQQWTELAGAGHFTPYQLGDGWKYVRRNYQVFAHGGYQLGDDSTTCVLLALADVCRDRQINVRVLYRTAYPDEETMTPDELSAWEIEYDGLMILPRD